MSDNIINISAEVLPFPGTEQGTATVPPPVLNADDLRTKMVEQFEGFKENLKAYHEYAQRVVALSIQYHDVRIAETLQAPIVEMTLVTTFNVGETPKTLDTKLQQMASIPNMPQIKKIIFDRAKGTYYLFI